MNKRKAFAMAIALLSTFGPLDALADTKKLSVGHADDDAAINTDYDARFDLTLVGADGVVRPNGYWTDKITHEDHDGQDVLKRHVRLFDAAGQQLLERVHLNDARTLAPKIVQQIGTGFGPPLYDLRFNGGHVEITLVATLGGPIQQLSVDLDPAPFDLAIWATFLMSLPFEAGYEAEFPILGPGPALAWEMARVIGPETLATPSGETFDTYKVETVNRPWTAWLRKDVPHIVKIIQNFPDGSYQISWLAEEGS